MHDPKDVDFWTHYEHIDLTRSELVTIHDRLMYTLSEPRLEHEVIAELMAIAENIEVILIRSGAMTKEEIERAHDEIAGDE